MNRTCHHCGEPIPPDTAIAVWGYLANGFCFCSGVCLETWKDSQQPEPEAPKPDKPTGGDPWDPKLPRGGFF